MVAAALQSFSRGLNCVGSPSLSLASHAVSGVYQAADRCLPVSKSSSMVCVRRGAGRWPSLLPPWPSSVPGLAFEAFPSTASLDLLRRCKHRRSRSRSAACVTFTLLQRLSLSSWTVSGPSLVLRLVAPPPVLLPVFTPRSRCRSPSVRRCQPSDLVPSSWSLTTSTVCSTVRPSGLLHPETGHGVHRVSSSRHPPRLHQR